MGVSTAMGERCSGRRVGVMGASCSGGWRGEGGAIGRQCAVEVTPSRGMVGEGGDIAMSLERPISLGGGVPVDLEGSVGAGVEMLSVESSRIFWMAGGGSWTNSGRNH